MRIYSIPGKTRGCDTLAYPGYPLTTRKALSSILFVLWPAAAALGQTILNFPLNVQPQYMNVAGIALVNPGPTAAIVSFKTYCSSNEGVAGTSGVLCTPGEQTGSGVQVIPARGQVAKLYSQVLSSDSSGGWLQIASSTPALVAFMVLGDYSRTLGGTAAAQPSADQILPFVADTFDAHFANPFDTAVTLNIRFYNAAGTEILPAVIRTLSPHAGYNETLVDFKGKGLEYLSAGARYARITGTGPFCATSIVSNYLEGIQNRDWGFINGIDVSQLGNDIIFPHVVAGAFGGSNYVTWIGVTNLSSLSQTLNLMLQTVDGAVISVQRTLPPQGGLREDITALFGTQPGFQSSWIRVTGTGPIAGFATYADLVSGGVAAFTGQNGGFTGMIFPQIADLQPFLTGLALVNAGTANANVEVFAMDPKGLLIGGAANVPTAAFAVPAGGKVSKLLRQLIPQTQARTEDGGFVFVRSTNNVPVFGLLQYFLATGAAIANVPAGGIATGLTYVPPSPSPVRASFAGPVEGLPNGPSGSDGGGSAAYPGIAVSTERVAVATTDFLALYTREGVLTDAQHWGTLFGSVQKGGEGFTTPTIVFDERSGRFFAVAMGGRFENTGCAVGECLAAHFLAVSKTANPTKATTADWYTYRLDGTIARTPAGIVRRAAFVDDPVITVNRDHVVISSHVQRFSDHAWLHTELRVLAVGPLLQGKAPEDWADISELNDPVTGRPVPRVQPALMLSDSPELFLVSFNQGSECSFLVWSLDLRSSPAVVRKRVLETKSKCVPLTPAPQPGGGLPLDAGDGRVGISPVFYDGSLWVARAIGYDFGSGPVVATLWAQLGVSGWPDRLDTVQFGVYGDASNWTAFPSIMVDGKGGAVLVFNRMSASEFASVRVATRGPTDPPNTWRTAVVVREGTAALAAGAGPNALGLPGVQSFSGRTGAARDPVDGSVWVTGQYVDHATLWKVWIAKVVRPD